MPAAATVKRYILKNFEQKVNMTTSLTTYASEDEVIVNITSYLDTILSKTYHRSRDLLKATDSLDEIYDILGQLDQEVAGELTPAQKVLVHNMHIRLDDALEILQHKWSNPVLAENSTKAMQSLYLRFVNNDPQVFQTSPMVHYSTTGNWKVDAIRGYITPRTVSTLNWYTGNRHIGVLLRCPLWVHDTMALISGDDPKGQAFREFYSKKDGLKGYTGYSPMSYRTYGCSVGAPVYELDPDTLNAATVLWEPRDKESIYHDFAHAALTARILN